MKLVLISDTHYMPDREAAVGRRLAGIADILLLRAVHRINRVIKPDAVLLLGDLVNDGSGPEGADQLALLQQTVDLLDCPCLAIPGNHDGAPDDFYRIFARPRPTVDVGGVRIASFVDLEEPGYNARRTDGDLRAMDAVRGDWRGPIIMAQHVPVFPPGACACPYNYLNVDDVLVRMKQQGIRLALAGHYHAGFGPIEADGMTFLGAPALCETPFPFLELDIDGDSLTVRRHELAMPAELALVDAHVHTHLAYCNENMDVALAMRIGKALGLADVRFAEHSGHLYFSRHDYGSSFASGVATAKPEDRRMEEYLEVLAHAGYPPARRGIEVDCCFDGAPLLAARDADSFPFRIGAMHQLPALSVPNPDLNLAAEEFLSILDRFLQPGIDVLAHPFRVFRRARQPLPDRVIEPTVQLLKERGIAGEINFHTNEPRAEFVRLCIDAGVKLTFGSDAHNLYEVGEFAPHLELLKRAGFDGDPRDVLLDRLQSGHCSHVPHRTK